MKTVHKLEHSNWVTCLSFGPVDTCYADKLFSSSADHTVRIWDIENEKVEVEFKHDDICNSFDIDKNGATLVVGHYVGVSVWSIRDNKQIAKIETDSSAINVRFNQSDDKIAVGCWGGEIYKITL